MGRFGTGIVFGAEIANAREALRNMKPGDSFARRKIVTLESGEEGHIELSLSEAGKQKLWQLAKELAESGEVIKAKIVAANAGGLMTIVAEELKANSYRFPQLSLEHYPKVPDGDRIKIAEELKKFVGQELNVKIIDVNARTNKVIVSEREVLSANVKRIVKCITPIGQIADVMVSGAADFGVFRPLYRQPVRSKVRFIFQNSITNLIRQSEGAR